MDKYEMARYNSHKKSQSFLAEHSSVFTGITLYGPLKTEYNLEFEGLEKSMQAQGINIEVITLDKGQLKIKMGEIVIKFALRGGVQAGALGMTELELALDVVLTYITKASDVDALIRARELKDLMKDYLTDLTEMEEADIDEMEKAIKEFSDIQVEPIKHIQTKKAEGTEQIVQFLGALDKTRKKISKIIQSYVPLLYRDWVLVSKIGAPKGTRKISIALKYIDADTKVELFKVKATLSNGMETIVKFSTKKGWIHFYSIATGTWSITSEHPVYETDVKTKIGVDEYHIERINIELRPKNTVTEDLETTTGIMDMIVYDKETGQPLSGVQFSVPSLNYVDTTDEDGEIYKDGLAPESLSGSLFCEGYKTMDVSFTIEAGKTTTLQLNLEKEAG